MATPVAAVVAGTLALAGCGTSTSASKVTTTTLRGGVAVAPWALSRSENQGTGHNVLNGATFAGTSAWAVGDWFNNSSDRTLVERLNSNGWTVVASPNASEKHNELVSVSGTSPSDVWAVGKYQPASGQERTLVEHFDGRAWRIVASPNVGQYHNELDSVVAITPSDAWAVGHFDENPTPADEALIEHWDGTHWHVFPAPKFIASVSDLNGIAATPKNGPIWAVGSQQFSNRSITLVCEFLDGVWRVVPSPNHGPYSNALLGVASVSLRDMWAVGAETHGASSFAVTMHWDGQDVDLERVPRRLTHHYVLSAVAADAARRIYAVGDYYSGRADVAAVLQWTGKKWVVLPSPSAGTRHNELLGVATIPAATPVAVGKYYSGEADRTLVVHCKC